MKKLTLTDLWRVLDNMVQRRMAAIQLLAMGALYEQQVRDLHARMGAIPGVRDGRRPFAKELADTDLLHDMYGRAADLLLQVYEVLAPVLSDDLNSAVAKGREVVIGSVSEVTEGYVDQSQRAQRRRPQIEPNAASLALFPVAEVGSLKELTERYTEQGEQIDNLLDQRGDAEAAEDTPSASLRIEALSLLADLAKAIELQRRSERRFNNGAPLPNNLEARIFGYARALIQLRNSGDTTSTPDADISLEPPVVEDGPTPVEG
ncbi:MAG: hypothetical protein AAFX99_28680 [Myxococcota bacterium]